MIDAKLAVTFKLRQKKSIFIFGKLKIVLFLYPTNETDFAMNADFQLRSMANLVLEIFQSSFKVNYKYRSFKTNQQKYVSEWLGLNENKISHREKVNKI